MKKLTLKMISDARAQIWGSEAYRVTIVYAVRSDGGDVVFYAECDDTLARKRLNLNNYTNVLNDMFYDFCVENAAWMGVS